jgi:hypothetical protein
VDQPEGDSAKRRRSSSQPASAQRSDSGAGKDLSSWEPERETGQSINFQNNMTKNRRNNSAGLLAGPALGAFCFCLFLAGSGVGYVWQRDQISKLGHQIKGHEIRLDELRRQTESLNRVLAILTSPQDLDARVKKMNLGLAAPQPEQLIRIVERPLELVQSPRVLMAQQRGGIP